MNTLICPSCGQRLTVSDRAPAMLTCPRCVGRVPNPHARVAGGTESADVPFAARAAQTPRPAWETRRMVALEQQAQRDARRSSYLMIGMAGVLGVGAAASWLAGGTTLGAMLTAAAIVVIIAAVLQLRYPENENVQQATGVVSLMAAGCAKVALILLGVLLLLFGACAMLIATSSFH